MTAATFRYFIIISSVAALIIIGLIIYLITKAHYKKEFLQKSRELQSSHMNEISQYEAQIHSLLDEINSKKQNQALLESLVSDCEKFVGEHYSGHSVVDALLAYKKKLCADSGVQLEISASTLETTDLTDKEYISIFGNLLDNAIEAAQKTALPWVKLKCVNAGGQWILTVKNSKLADEKPLENNMATTKSNSSSHGLGSKIVKKIIKTHNGALEYKDYGDYFEVTAAVPSAR